MQMYDGVKQSGTAVTLASCCGAYHLSTLVYYWKSLLLIIHVFCRFLYLYYRLVYLYRFCLFVSHSEIWHKVSANRMEHQNYI